MMIHRARAQGTTQAQGGIGAGFGRQESRGPAVMIAQILQQGPEIVHADQKAMTSGAIQHIANYDAPCGQRDMADGAGASGFAGYLNTIFIDWRRALAAAVIADQ